mmetsp:Transcript_6494/g.8551  ORF Transcript_6494/g.8551 Transcript_6494/m.8551 type:complete len:81 (-) Transcript_6494:1216-1458(-)
MYSQFSINHLFFCPTDGNKTGKTKQSIKMSNAGPSNPVELGSIEYVNLSTDKMHGDYQTAVDEATKSGKPIFANFAEWPG